VRAKRGGGLFSSIVAVGGGEKRSGIWRRKLYFFDDAAFKYHPRKTPSLFCRPSPLLLT